MKTTRIAILALAAFGLAIFGANSVFAQTTTNLTVNATVVQSLSVSQTAALDFGTFALMDSTTTGTRVTSGSDTNIQEFSGATAGAISISGAPGQAVDVSVSSATLSDTAGNGGADMEATLTAANTTVTLDATTGTGSTTINGSLAIAAGQIASTYQGTATVTVNY